MIFESYLKRTGIVLLLLAGSCGSDLVADPHDPEIERAALVLAEGYEVNLFASERDGVIKPIQIRFDPAGRLWTVGSTVYPQIAPGEEPNDKVVVLEDTDHDGRADKSTVFADGLMIPTGLELGDGGVYVGQETQLLHLKDTDGDGKADQRRVVLRGFGTGDSHQTINSFTWGPGGELMMCQGLHALSRVETPWGIEVLHSAGVWRLRPRLLRLDPFLNREMGPQNPFGIAFDQWGQPMLMAGNGQGVYYLTPAMIRAEHHLRLPSLWNRGRKFGGGDFVENSHFPPEAQGELISGSYLNNSVYRFRVTEDGAGFRVEDLPPLITSTNLSFRIVDVRFGPDGALYLCDWYNAVIGHYQASFRHPDRDKTHGRIWRVTAKGRPLVERPNLERALIPQLLEQLKSPERWTRQMSKRVLADRPTTAVTNALNGWIKALDRSEEQFEHHLFEAIGVYESHEIAAPEPLWELLRARDPRARAYAVRVVGHWNKQLSEPLQYLRHAANDSHPRVRLEAVVAASYVEEGAALDVALMAADHPIDSFIEYALIQTIHTLKPHWRRLLASGQLELEEHPARLEFLIRADGSPDTVDFLVTRLKSAQLNAKTHAVFSEILSETGGPNELRLILNPSNYHISGQYDPAVHAAGLRGLVVAERVRRVRPAGTLAELLQPLITSAHAEVRAEAMRLAGAWALEPFRADIESVAVNSRADLLQRRAAIEALILMGGEKSQPILWNLSDSVHEPGVMSAAISALTEVDMTRALERGRHALAKQLAEPYVREILLAFVRREGGAGQLAKALKGQSLARETAQLGLEFLNASGRRDPELGAVLANAAGTPVEVRALTPEALDGLAEAVRTSGNAARGKEVYERAELGCTACHAVGGVGGQIGPDLGALGSAQSIEFIIGAILEPNKEVKEGFFAVEVTSKDGTQYQGYLTRESPQEIVLRDLLEAREIRLRKDEIRDRKQHGSVMPVGLVDTLSDDDFRDLVRYLSELR